MELINKEDVFIVVMGLTGAGKSSFISLCTQEPLEIVGHGLSSCTTQVMLHSMTWNNRTIHLIDTPGFNDTGRSDGETLQELAFWLAAAHERELQLSGLIYLHPMTSNRLQGSGVRSLNAFKKIVGEENYHGVIFATTRWDEIAAEQMETATKREKDMRAKVGDIVERGGRVVSLSAGRIDAMKIISHIANRGEDKRLTLAFQRQLVDDGLAIHETDAGRLLFEQLSAELEETNKVSHAALEAQFKALQTEYIGAAAERQADIRRRIKPLEEDMERMMKNAGDIKKVWEERLRREAEALAEAKKVNEEQLTAKRRELSRIHDQSSPRSTTSRSVSLRPPNEGRHIINHSDLLSSQSSPASRVHSPGRSAISEGNLQREIEDLDHQQHLYEIWEQRRPDRRYTKPSGYSTTFGVIGTGLAVVQLVAAVACTVM